MTAHTETHTVGGALALVVEQLYIGRGPVSASTTSTSSGASIPPPPPRHHHPRSHPHPHPRLPLPAPPDDTNLLAKDDKRLPFASAVEQINKSNENNWKYNNNLVPEDEEEEEEEEDERQDRRRPRRHDFRVMKSFSSCKPRRLKTMPATSRSWQMFN